MAVVKYRRKRWIADYRDGFGKRRWKTCKSKEAGEAFLAEIVLDRQQPIETRLDPDMTFEDYARKWMQDISASLEPRTVECYEQNLRLHILPAFGPIKLRLISRDRIKSVLAEKLSKGLLRNTVKLIHSTLRVVLNEAIEDGLIKSNPSAGIGKRMKLSAAPNHREEETKAFDRPQLQALLTAAQSHEPRYYPMILTMARSGIRPGEAMALTWDDLDFERQEMLISKTLTRHRESKGTKSGKSRNVDMSDQVRDTLRRLEATRKAETLKEGRSEVPPWVFITEAGTPMDGSQTNKIFKRILNKAKLPRHYTPHCLRHTFASQLLADGISVAYVSAMIGHSDISLTVNLYGRWLPKGNKANVNRLDAGYSQVADPIGTESEKEAPSTATSELMVAEGGSKVPKWDNVKLEVIEKRDINLDELGHLPPNSQMDGRLVVKML